MTWPISLLSVPKYLRPRLASRAAGKAPRQRRRTISQCTVPRMRWVKVPTPLVSEAKARSVPTATAGETPNNSVNSGVISEPPPTPVMPTNRPTAKPDATNDKSMQSPKSRLQSNYSRGISKQRNPYLLMRLFIWLGCDAQVRSCRGKTLGILLLQHVRILHGQRNDDVVAVFPVAWRGHGVAVGQLQGVDYAQHFVEVAAGAHRIGQAQAHFFVRIDDEQRAHGG